MLFLLQNREAIIFFIAKTPKDNESIANMLSLIKGKKRPSKTKQTYSADYLSLKIMEDNQVTITKEG